MSDHAQPTTGNQSTRESTAAAPRGATAKGLATVAPFGAVAAARMLAAGGGAPGMRRCATAQQHQAILAVQRTLGNAAVQRLRCADRPGPSSTGSAPIRRQHLDAPPTQSIPLRQCPDDQLDSEYTALRQWLLAHPRIGSGTIQAREVDLAEERFRRLEDELLRRALERAQQAQEGERRAAEERQAQFSGLSDQQLEAEAAAVRTRAAATGERQGDAGLRLAAIEAELDLRRHERAADAVRRRLTHMEARVRADPGFRPIHDPDSDELVGYYWRNNDPRNPDPGIERVFDVLGRQVWMNESSSEPSDIQLDDFSPLVGPTVRVGTRAVRGGTRLVRALWGRVATRAGAQVIARLRNTSRAIRLALALRRGTAGAVSTLEGGAARAATRLASPAGRIGSAVEGAGAGAARPLASGTGLPHAGPGTAPAAEVATGLGRRRRRIIGDALSGLSRGEAVPRERVLRDLLERLLGRATGAEEAQAIRATFGAAQVADRAVRNPRMVTAMLDRVVRKALQLQMSSAVEAERLLAARGRPNAEYIQRALSSIAEEEGLGRLRVLNQSYRPGEFERLVVGRGEAGPAATPQLFIDNSAQIFGSGTEHGDFVHCLQLLVAHGEFSRVGLRMTLHEFMRNMGRWPEVWRVVFDFERGMNRPEALTAVLRRALGPAWR